MGKVCWACGHYAFWCFVNDTGNYIVGADDTCDKWCPEGTKGTVTDFGGDDETTWVENEYLQDDESNL